MSASCKPRVQYSSLTQAMDGRIVRCGGIISFCQSAPSSKIVQALLVASPVLCQKRYSKYGTLLFFTLNA